MRTGEYLYGVENGLSPQCRPKDRIGSFSDHSPARTCRAVKVIGTDDFGVCGRMIHNQAKRRDTLLSTEIFRRIACFKCVTFCFEFLSIRARVNNVFLDIVVFNVAKAFGGSWGMTWFMCRSGLAG